MLQNLISSGYYKTGSATWGAFQRWKIHNKQFFTNLEGTGKVHTQRCNIMHYKSAHYHHILWWTVGIIQCRFVQNLYTLDAVHEDGWDLLEIFKVECTGDWQLHLDESRMLPYFAASSHYRYQTSVYLYLQTLSQIHIHILAYKSTSGMGCMLYLEAIVFGPAFL